MKIFYALSIILLTSLEASSQSRPSSPETPVTKVVRFYPNPATSYITFELQKDSAKNNYSFQIYNMLGKKVYETNNVTARNVISLSDFFRGLYIFQLKDKSGKLIESGKFQVSK